MSQCNSIEMINSNLRDEKKIRLNEINKIKDYFSSEIQKRKMHCCI